MSEFLEKPLSEKNLYPNPDTESAEHDADEKKLLKKLEKKNRWRHKLALRVGAAAIAVSTITNAYWADVQSNRTEQDAAEISLNVIASPLNEINSNKATVFIDGFNSFDADFLAGNMGPAVQQVADGELWSLSYNNAVLSRGKIYKTIIELAEERNIDSISIVGYSMGGIIGTEAASDIVKNTTLPVNSLIMVSTPDGSEGVRPYQKEELSFMQWLSEWVPGAIDSSWFRFAGEVYFYRDNYLKGDYKDWSTDFSYNTGLVENNIESFFRTFDSASERLNDPRATSLQLLSQQVYKVDRFNMLNELKTIADQRDEKQMPVLLYLGTGKPGYDTVVNDELSSADFAEYTKETNIDYLSFLVPGAIHSHYFDTPEEYLHTFNEASIPMTQNLESEINRRSTPLYAQEFAIRQKPNIFTGDH